MNSFRVVVVGGAMRSGTTVIHRVLCTAQNSNPYISESWFLADIMRLYRWNLSKYEIRNLDQFGDSKNFRELIWLNVRQYLSLLSSRYGDPELLIIKHPELTYYFTELAVNFLNFKFIIIVRDPRDVIASILRVAKRHKDSKLITPQTEISEIKDYCKNYNAYYNDVLKREGLLKNRMIFVKYEDFVMNPRKELERINLFCGAQYDYERALDFLPEHSSAPNFDKDKRLQDKFSGAFWSELYTKPITSDAVGAFKKELTKKEIEDVQTYTHQIGNKFGYW